MHDVTAQPSEERSEALPAAAPARPWWHKWAGFAMSAAMAGFLVHQMAAIGWSAFFAALPTNPMFYLLFAAMYLTLPVAELAIFRRLWEIGPGSLWVFLRKRVLNDAVLGYSGEAYLYLWARRQPGFRISAMGAVKDVSITSALAANAVTIGILIGLLLFDDQLVSQGLFSASQLRQLEWGAALLCVPAFLVLLFSNKVMTLPRGENVTIFGIHVLRLIVSTGLLLLAWHFALPLVAMKVWLVLAALRMVVNRIPFAPNTELLFSTIGVGLTGAIYSEVAAVLALSGALMLVLHALVLAGDSTWRLRRSVGAPA